DGSVRWLSGSSLPEREPNGDILWHGFMTDITERKQMEEKLRDSEAFNSCILNSLNSQIAVLDRHGVIIAVNGAWRQFDNENGVLPIGQDMLGHHYLDACKNCDESDAVRAGISAVTKGKQKTFFLEYPCDMLNQRNWFHMSVLPLQNLNHEVVISLENITARKKAEQVLVQLKAMIDISLDGFWIVDLMGNLLQVNESYAKMSGYSVDELLNMPISQLEALEDPAQIKAHIGKVAMQGHDLFETRHRHKDGHLIDIEISVAFLPEHQQFCVFCRNITERKRIENELKASEAKFRSLIDISPVPIALTDGQFNINLVNQAFVKTFGYTLEDIPTLADWRPKAYPDPDYRQWVKTTWQMTLEKAEQNKGAFPPIELEIHCKNNNIKTVLASAAAIDQSFSGVYLVILYDITQRIQTEAKLNAIFNASVEGIITFDQSDIIVSSNAAVETIFGYKPNELLGCSMNKLIAQANAGLLHSMPSAGQIKEIEGLRKNGSIVPLDLSIAEYSIDNARYFTAIVRDVSLRKHREKQDKEHLNQLAHITRLGLMGEMASGIAHEVNQPLSAISSYTQVSLNLVNTENTDLAKLSEILLKTQQQALRAGRIIHRMRDFVNFQSKHRSSADINTLINDAVNFCITELNHHNIKLTFNLENHLPAINVDHVQIEQVIINLIRNSIDVLEKLPGNQQRNLSIHSQLTPQNGIQVRIKDNGPGIDESQQQKILMPFYTTKPEGMGMGLSISRSLIEAHEGTLHFNSQPGKGSTFYFTLPPSIKSDEN
ncbi:MAG: PAS domain S-box protein, partial [Methylococcales bacterium]|nr:PAS domain S-box protein [Methylococcales bacterium]